MVNKKARRTIWIGLHHIVAIVIAIIIGVISVNSNILVENLYGEVVRYSITPFEDAENFEDSTIFNDIFRNALSDITRYAMIKGQMETNGEFDGNKIVDVTEYVNRKTKITDTSVTAQYKLVDLIKWGKYGLEMQDVRFNSKIEFLQYFGMDFVRDLDIILEDELLQEDAWFQTLYSMEWQEGDEIEWVSLIDDWQLDNIFDAVIEKMAENGKMVTVTENNGKLTISFSMLVCQYDTFDGKKLVNLVDNWIDYSTLEANVINTIYSLSNNYSLYDSRNDLYAGGNSNLQFLIRTRTSDGIQYYTNMPSDLAKTDDVNQNKYFTKLGKYVIYSVADMKCESNAGITTDEMFQNISGYEYAFSDSTKIWIGVNTSYPIQNDQFALANMTYENIVPYVWHFIVIGIISVMAWFILLVYLTKTSGETDEKVKVSIKYFDRIPMELYLLLVGFAIFFTFKAGAGIREIVATNVYNRSIEWMRDSSQSRSYVLLLIAGYGLAINGCFSVLWFSLVRRVKNNSFWPGSILSKICAGFVELGRRMMQHRSAAIRTIIPYNVFVLINICGVLLTYLNREKEPIVYLGIFAGLLLFDVLIGMFIFARASERNEIIEGIANIREGKVDFVIDSEKLHGDNRDMAEAVNKIGEGIRKAVATSMKDEQMKADLITNVSHDIKTPLTSIINYVDLLKREKITQEPAKGYIEILDAKSQRLKQLTDDLVEASKISSGNVVLDMVVFDLQELVKQSVGEFADKLETKGLSVFINECSESTFIYADSRRMWRVVENLFNNICKYAMTNTRVYIDISKNAGQVIVSFKNISEISLNVKPDELTERFMRGDASRTTEGSGLGLSIAKNLTQLQHGEFDIILDGDLFKVVISFPEYNEEV